MSAPRSPRDDARRLGRARMRGIALVIVLWVLALASVIAASFVAASRTETLLSRNQVASTRVRLLAEAGIERALYELFKPIADPTRWQTDGRAHDWVLDGASVRVIVRDETARLDINRAEDELIEGLLRNAGLDNEQLARLADEIADWRDADDFRRPNGAEARDYEAAGLAWRPANGRFENIEQLRLVLHMTPDLYRRLSPLLTVHASRDGFNSRSAPPEVLATVPGVTAEAVAQYVAERAQARAEGRPVPIFAPALAYDSMNTAFYDIVAQAQTEDGITFVRETSVYLPHSRPGRVVHLTWREAPALAPPQVQRSASDQRN